MEQDSGLHGADRQDAHTSGARLWQKMAAIGLSFALAALMFFSLAAGGNVAGGVGGAVGAMIPAALVVLLFQVGKRFRNARSRWKIVMWAQFWFLLGQVLALMKALSAGA